MKTDENGFETRRMARAISESAKRTKFALKTSDFSGLAGRTGFDLRIPTGRGELLLRCHMLLFD
jgi:hypothetical protein